MQKAHEDPVMRSLREIQDLEEGRIRDQAARAAREVARRREEAEQAEVKAREESALRAQIEADQRRAQIENERAEILRAENERRRIEITVRAEAEAKAEAERQMRIEAHALKLAEIQQNTRSGVSGWAVVALSVLAMTAALGGLYAVAWRPLQRAHHAEMARIQGQIAQADEARANAERDRDRTLAEANRVVQVERPAVVAPSAPATVATRRVVRNTARVNSTAAANHANDPINLENLDPGSELPGSDDLARTSAPHRVRATH